MHGHQMTQTVTRRAGLAPPASAPLADDDRRRQVRRRATAPVLLAAALCLAYAAHSSGATGGTGLLLALGGAWPACAQAPDTGPLAALDVATCGGGSSRRPAAWVPCDQLQRVQRDNTLIVSNVNCGFVDFASNFWRAYAALNRTNILFLAEDCAAYQALVALAGADHVARPLGPPKERQAQGYSAAGFSALMRARPAYTQYFHDAGYNVLWQDTDSVPILDPFQFLPPALDAVFTNDTARLAGDDNAGVCGGFLYLKGGSAAAGWLLRRWAVQLGADRTNQAALNRALRDALDSGVYDGSAGPFAHLVLPQRRFPSGKLFPRFKTEAAWCHANWREGRDAKRAFLQEHGLWDAGARGVECND